MREDPQSCPGVCEQGEDDGTVYSFHFEAHGLSFVAKFGERGRADIGLSCGSWILCGFAFGTAMFLDLGLANVRGAH